MTTSQKEAGVTRKRRGDHTRRYQGLCVLLGATLLAVGVRLLWLQAISAPAYAERAAEQRTRDWEIPARRGTLYDRDGEPLAVTVEGRTVYAVPRTVVDPPGAARVLASVLGGSEESYLEKLTRDTGFVFIKRKADLEKAQILMGMDLAGIHFMQDFSRSYPGGSLACQTLGFVGVDDIGLSGLESQYDDLLAGEPGRIVAERDPFGRIIPGGLLAEIPPVDGTSLVLTLDREIQHEAQTRLAEAVETAGAKAGSVIVMSPEDGDILALASVPSFDLNDPDVERRQAFRNRAITDQYEPGSTMKSFTAAAVIEQGIFGADDVFRLPPTIEVGGRTIHESHPRKPVDWSLTDIVVQSSNVGAVKIGMELGDQRLFDSFVGYGFREKTGVDFPGEASGSLMPPEEWSASTIANLPFGQGMSVTPVQLARAFCAIANGGELVTPHFAEAILDDSDASLSWPKRRAMSPETAEQMREILTAVVVEGTGRQAAVDGYTVAGKTGTAQKAPYREGRYIASFAGFLPVEDPEVVIVVTVDEPTNGIWGGSTAGPVFSELGAFCMTHLEVRPPSSPADPVPEEER